MEKLSTQFTHVGDVCLALRFILTVQIVGVDRLSNHRDGIDIRPVTGVLKVKDPFAVTSGCRHRCSARLHSIQGRRSPENRTTNGA